MYIETFTFFDVIYVAYLNSLLILKFNVEANFGDSIQTISRENIPQLITSLNYEILTKNLE